MAAGEQGVRLKWSPLELGKGEGKDRKERKRDQIKKIADITLV